MICGRIEEMIIEDDGKRAYACGPLCWPERSDPLGGVRGGCWGATRMTESALTRADRCFGLSEATPRGGLGGYRPYPLM